MSMKNAILASFVFLTAYGLSIIFQWMVAVLFLLSLSPVVVLWVAYRILKDPHPSGHTFEDRFYEDYDYQRNR